MKTGKIYKIIVREGNEIYIGSTFNKRLNERFLEHKREYRKYMKGKKTRQASSMYLFDKYGVENCKLILVKEYNVCDKKHLEMYEQLWINKLKPINKNSSFSIKRFYDKNRRITNKEYYKEYMKQYYENNKDKLKKKLNEKVKCEVCDCYVRKDKYPRHTKSLKHKNNL